MLTRLKVTNYRCLRDVTVDFEPLTVLIGKNDTGKSTLLDAILTVHSFVPPGDFVRSVARRWATGCEIEAVHRFMHGPEPQVARVCISTGDDQAPTMTQDGFFVPEGSPRSEMKEMARRRAAVRAESVQLAASSLGAAGPIVTSADELPRLAEDGDGLVGMLDYLLGDQRSAFDWIESELCRLMPAVKGVRLLPARYSRHGAEVPGKEIRIATTDGSVVATSDVSDGVLLMLGFLTLAKAPNRAPILLMEEPENGLHPRLLQEAVRVLEAITAAGTQIVLTTHSPYLLDFVRPECVRVFHRDDAHGVRVKPLSALPGFAEWTADGASLGEMWFNAGEEALFDDAHPGGE